MCILTDEYNNGDVAENLDPGTVVKRRKKVKKNDWRGLRKNGQRKSEESEYRRVSLRIYCMERT